ncbi:MAG: hypothetical protein ACOYWZ_16100 [Bacillota bacterium]
MAKKKVEVEFSQVEVVNDEEGLATRIPSDIAKKMGIKEGNILAWGNINKIATIYRLSKKLPDGAEVLLIKD